MFKTIIINSSGFPYGTASVEKVKLLTKGFYEQNYQSYVLNMYSNIEKNDNLKLKSLGRFENTIYIYTSGKSYKLKKVKRLSLLPITLLKDFFIIKRILKNCEKKIIILQYTQFIFVIWYRMLSKVLGAKLVINTMEYHVAIKPGISAKLFDKYSYYFSDGVIVISEYLKKLVKYRFPKKPILKIPVTVDFSLFKNNVEEINDNSLFCANAGHIRVFKFIIDSFNYVHSSTHTLLLIASGKSYEIDNLKNEIEKSPKSSKIKLLSFISYEELVNKYQTSKLLLIPLFNDIRDIARFPHKIGEYTAAKRPILSTPYGEVTYYFQKNKNILFSRDDSVESFGKAFDEAISLSEEELNRISREAYKVGEKYFDYKKQGKLLSEFFNRL